MFGRCPYVIHSQHAACGASRFQQHLNKLRDLPCCSGAKPPAREASARFLERLATSLWSASVSSEASVSDAIKRAGAVKISVIINLYTRHYAQRVRAGFHVGEWLSLVEHLVRDQGVGGSNPLSPTIISKTYN